MIREREESVVTVLIPPTLSLQGLLKLSVMHLESHNSLKGATFT